MVGANPKCEVQPNIFTNFPSKLHENEKKWIPGGVHPFNPPPCISQCCSDFGNGISTESFLWRFFGLVNDDIRPWFGLLTQDFEDYAVSPVP